MIVMLLNRSYCACMGCLVRYLRVHMLAEAVRALSCITAASASLCGLLAHNLTDSLVGRVDNCCMLVVEHCISCVACSLLIVTSLKVCLIVNNC